MKIVRLMVLAIPLLLTGCSTLSDLHWSNLWPMNWFGSSLKVSEQGVGDLNGSTPMTELAISDALKGNYRLRSGMKSNGGEVVRYFEALDDKTVMLIITGNADSVSRVEVLDKSIETAAGVRIGTPFETLFDKAFGACMKATGDDSAGVLCKAPGSQHISYLFNGEWQGPQALMPSDDTLKKWTLSKIIWRR